jgi:SAM-dependent methyltransferase
LTVAKTEDNWQKRSRSFGAIAAEYDRVRPSYPAEMIDAIVGLLPGRYIAEIGAGTGKATVPLAGRDLDITAVEPDPGMAAVLGAHVGDRANVHVVVSSFEDWQPDREFDGLLAAQSWHWTAPDQRYPHAARVVRTGGLLALFWNVTDWSQTPISDEIDDVYRRHGVVLDTSRRRALATPDSWPRSELAALTTFADVEVRSYPWQRTYTTQEWTDYIGSTSDHLVMDADRRHALLADVRRLIDAAGGTLTTYDRCDLYLARRTAVSA